MKKDIIEIRCHGICEQISIIIAFSFLEIRINGRKY
jgi:hypothetical protein